jgi:hypothetical protein
VLFFAVSLPAVTARLYSSDEVQYFSYLRSLYFDRDVSFENEYRYFYDHHVARSDGFHETFLERETRIGRRVNYATMGAGILWAPFYAAADVWTRAAGAPAADGFSQPYISAVAYGSAFYAFLAILLSIRAARMVLGDRGGFIGGLAIWLGTPLLFYMYVAPPFSHACSAFAVALFVNVWLHVRRTWSPAGTFTLGLCAALMAMVREQDAFLAIGPAVDFLTAPSGFVPSAFRRKAEAREQPLWRFLVAALAGILGFVLAYSPQLAAYNALNGYPGPAEHVQRKMSWYSPHALQVLASPSHGFFFWTPLAIPAIAGLCLMAAQRGDADRRAVGIAFLLMLVSQVYVAGSVESWTVAGAFGQRRFICLTVALVVGLAALLQVRRGAVHRIAAVVVLGAMVWWNVALIAQFATRMMDRQRLEPARNAYHAFVTLPIALPTLVYRYLFDRESFYDARPVSR